MGFVNGVEISVTWRHRSVHIVGLDFDIENEALQNLLAQVRQGRLKRLAAIAAKLEKKGIVGAYQRRIRLGGQPRNGELTHIADYLIQAGHVRNKAKLSANIWAMANPPVWHTNGQVWKIAWRRLKARAGLAVIAHPMRYGFSATAKRNLFEEFKALGGDGIEVHSGNCDKNDRLNYALLAERFGLMAGCGSDFHRLGDYSGGVLGICPELPPNCKPVWANFQTA